MRLIIADAEEADVKEALGNVDLPGASVVLNPKWLTPDPSETLWVALGAPAIKMVQNAGWIPKKGGVVSLRGKLFQNIQPDGWTTPINLGVSYAPQIMNIEYADFVTMQTDLSLYRRFELTGTMDAKLGDYRYADDFSGVIRYCKKMHEATGKPVEVALDTETEGLNPFDPKKRLVCIQISAKPGIADVFYTLDQFKHYQDAPGKWTNTPAMDSVIGQLQWLLTCPYIKLIGANLKYDLLWLRVKLGLICTNFAFDTCNGGSLVDENRNNTLNLHTKIYSPELGGYDDAFNASHDKAKMGEVPKPDLLPYAGGDADACLRNYHKIKAQVLADNNTVNGKPARNSLTGVYMNVVHPALSALHKMEFTGAMVDREKFHEFGADLENRMTETTTKALKVIPKFLLDKYGLNEAGGAPLSKPKMIAEFLFTPSGLNLEPLMTTEKTGAASTSEQHLAQFKDHPEAGPLLDLYLDYKSVAKMFGTYYEGFLKHLRPDDRWHASYIIHKQGSGKDNEQAAGGTVTGRGSATDPAFQCVTGDTEIMTPAGIRTAAELIDPLIPNNATNPYVAHEMQIAGKKGWVTTSNVFKSWRSDLLRVRLRNGNEITCTPEHPFWTNVTGWVTAKDLRTDHRLPIIQPVERPHGPAWITPDIGETLGIVAAVGYLEMTLPFMRIKIPTDFLDVVLRAFDELGMSRSVDSNLETGGSVVTYKMAEKLTPDQARFICALPDPKSDTLPKEARGTKAYYHIMRGVIRATGAVKKFSMGRTVLELQVAQKDLARAILRETALDGQRTPILTPMEKRYRLLLSKITAHHVMKACGLPPVPHTPKRQDRSNANPMSAVEYVVPAGAGWVYDFTVPDEHAFIANGVLVHNTVPKHSYWGKRLRACIIAPEGYRILARDYSQGELKVAACWAGEAQMIKAYLNKIDLHTLTAATVNGMSYEEAMHLKANDYPAYEILRQNGKAGNFGLLYGMSAYGFMMYAEAVYGVHLTLDEAEAMRDAFFGLYPGLPEWHDRQILEASTTGEVRSPLGRIRHLPNINSPIKKVRKKAQNQAINSPIQATLVDMMWWSMGIIERDQPKLLNPFAQIHDQGLWYVRDEDVDKGLQYSGEVMEDLPFEKTFGWKPELVFNTDAEIGCDLANLEKV